MTHYLLLMLFAVILLAAPAVDNQPPVIESIEGVDAHTAAAPPPAQFHVPSWMRALGVTAVALPF